MRNRISVEKLEVEERKEREKEEKEQREREERVKDAEAFVDGIGEFPLNLHERRGVDIQPLSTESVFISDLLKTYGNGMLHLEEMVFPFLGRFHIVFSYRFPPVHQSAIELWISPNSFPKPSFCFRAHQDEFYFFSFQEVVKRQCETMRAWGKERHEIHEALIGELRRCLEKADRDCIEQASL